MPEVDEVLVTGGGIKGTMRLLRWSRRARADVLLVPFPSNRWQYNLLARLSGARRRVIHHFDNARLRSLGFLRADRLPAVRGIHDVEQNTRLLRALGIELDSIDAPTFAVSEDDRRRADDLLRGAGIASYESFIVIHAGSGKTVIGAAKRWPARKYQELIDALAGEGVKLVLVEGPDERGVADEIINGRSAISAATILRLTGPLGDAAAVLERAELYIGSDSGLAHLAAAVGTKPVTIFAPADPDRVCPFGHRELVVQPAKSCAPCIQYPWNTPYPKILCRAPLCIDEVTVEQVICAVRRALVPSPSGRGLG
jgi:ADP-heptose:LPS heptosyltransferase